MGPTYPIEPARPDDRAAALRLLFTDLPPAEVEQRIANALELISSGDMDPAGLLVERDPESVLGVLVCVLAPGASALFWPPRSVADDRQTEREDHLLAQGLHWVRSRGARMAQSLLAREEMHLAPSLRRNGFLHICRLWYLSHNLDLTGLDLENSSELDFESYQASEPALFHQTLQRSYEGTLDCPEINGVRSLEDVIVGHQAQGRFDPSRWWLVRREGHPIGVLLLTEIPESGEWDISYLGIVPESRRQGLGRELVRKALTAAKSAGANGLTLAVDGRNIPALRLYRGLGFEQFDAREAFLFVWR